MTEHAFDECFVVSDPTSALPDEVLLSCGADGIKCNDPGRKTTIEAFMWPDVMAVCAIIPSTDPDEMEEFAIHVKNKGRFAFEVNDSRKLRAACRKCQNLEQKDMPHDIKYWLQALEKKGTKVKKHHCLTDTDPSGFLPDEFWSVL